jgi:hypothetical protein
LMVTFSTVPGSVTEASTKNMRVMEKVTVINMNQMSE